MVLINDIFVAIACIPVNQPNMYTIIAATNRKGSNALKVANIYLELAKAEGLDVKLLSLEKLTGDIIHEGMYDDSVGLMAEIQDEYLKPADKFIFIVPEYNGSFPGIFKLFIDASDLPECWYGKKVCLVGEAAGRAGNLRGLDQLTCNLAYMHMNVFWDRVPISSINSELNEDGRFADSGTLAVLRKQLQGFIEF